MEDEKNMSGQRKIYYDHEPAYQSLREKGESGWRSGGKSAPFNLYWNIFKACELLPPPNARVLDFGCGGGEFSLLLAQNGYQVIGIDYSRTAVQMAEENAKRARSKNVKFYCQDALKPRLKLSSFAAIFSISVLHCLLGQDRMTYWNNAKKLLKKEGVIALATMVDFPKDKNWIKELKINKRTRTDALRHRYFASEKQIRAELESAGLEMLYCARRKEVEDKKGCDDLIIIAQK